MLPFTRIQNASAGDPVMDYVRLSVAADNLPIVQLVVPPVNNGSITPNAVVCCFKAWVDSFRKNFHHLMNSLDVILILIVI